MNEQYSPKQPSASSDASGSQIGRLYPMTAEIIRRGEEIDDLYWELAEKYPELTPLEIGDMTARIHREKYGKK